MADEVVGARFVKGGGQGRDLAGQNHHVQIGVLQLKPMLHIPTGDVKGDCRADRHPNLRRGEGPDLGQNVDLVFARCQFPQTRVGKGPRIRRARGLEDTGVNALIGRWNLDAIAKAGNGDRRAKDQQKEDRELYPGALIPIHMKFGRIVTGRGFLWCLVFCTHDVIPRDNMVI